MTEDFSHVFPDTKEFPTPDEMAFLKELETWGGYKDMKVVETKRYENLVEKGYVYIFYLSSGERYICLTKSVACRPVTFHFYAYQIKMGTDSSGQPHVLSDEEQKKMAIMRKFVANWIFKKDIISDKAYGAFLRFFTITIPFILSVPKFLVNQMEEDLLETGIKYEIITPEFKAVRCQMCGCEFDSSSTEEFFPCPECKENILVR